MRVLMLSKACVVGAYQRKLEEIAARPGIELTVVVPPEWRDERGVLRLERAHVRGYELKVEPIAFNGSFHLHFYPRLGRLLAALRPDIVHIDEEPYNFATWHVLQLARRQGARTLFFSWQNLLRRYPPPFNWFESDVLCRADAAITGSRAAADVWRAKGYTGPIYVIPQFGVDPAIYAPLRSAPAEALSPAGLDGRQGVAEGYGGTVGYVGRLVAEKGLDILLRAVVRLPPAVRLSVLGSGPELKRLRRLASQLGLAGRTVFEPPRSSAQMPAYYARLDCLVLPSRRRPNWQEQFGRVLIEAMACGVPVIGSNCGEIPNVIGEAGLVFAEGDAEALAAQLRAILGNADLRRRLAAAGRARVLAHYTQARIAEATVEVYRSLIGR